MWFVAACCRSRVCTSNAGWFGSARIFARGMWIAPGIMPSSTSLFSRTSTMQSNWLQISFASDTSTTGMVPSPSGDGWTPIVPERGDGTPRKDREKTVVRARWSGMRCE